MKDTMKSYFKDINERDLLYQANKISVMIQEGNYLSNNTNQNELLAILEERSIEENRCDRHCPCCKNRRRE